MDTDPPRPLSVSQAQSASRGQEIALRIALVAALAIIVTLVAVVTKSAAIVLSIGAVIAVLLALFLFRSLRRGLVSSDEHQADRMWEASDHAELYRQMAERSRVAEAASAAKSLALATAAHELRTPLGGMLGVASVLAETPLTAEQETFVRAIGNSGELMLGLLDDLLDFAKIEAGRFTLDPRPTDLARLAEDVVELFARRAESKGLDLAADVEVGSQVATVDGVRLRQVLINLVANAIDFTSAGGVALSVASDAAGLRFAVEDTGRGVPEAEARGIFEPFQHTDPEAGHRLGGHGLGLSIARTIVVRMGGDLAVSARPGGGSIFSFVLPATAEGRADTLGSALAGRHILLVAAAGLAPAVMARQLTAAGASLAYAGNPIEAETLLSAAGVSGPAFDALLLDPRTMTEPAAVLSQLRRSARRPLPAAILLAPGRREKTTELRAAGFDAYLVRPVRRASLLRIAEQLMTSAEFGIDPEDRAHPLAPPGTARLTVLLAEDDEINALLFRSVLRRSGHEVVEVADGESAIRLLAKRSFDAAVIDLQLPAADGFAVARAVRGETPSRRARLVAVTADARPDTKEAAHAAGFDRVLLKPVTPDSLHNALSLGPNAAAA